MPSLRLVVSEHANLLNAPEMTKKDKFLVKYFSYFLYKMASGIIVVSEGTKRVFSEDTGINLKEIKVIYNPLRPMPATNFLKEDSELVSWWGTSKRLLAVGRLAEVKDYITLLKAFSLLPSTLERKANYT